LREKLPSKLFNSWLIAMGLAPKDALSWRDSIDTGFRPNNEGNFSKENRVGKGGMWASLCVGLLREHLRFQWIPSKRGVYTSNGLRPAIEESGQAQRT
jgi:hypothetical protein